MTDILVIDDDPVYGELTLQRLEGTGFSTSFFLGPFGSVSIIRQVMPRLLILDINMPGLDGTSILDLVWKSRALTGMRVVLHSSLDQHELERMAERHGADLALIKSTPGELFVSQIVRLLGSGMRTSMTAR
ncbi:MAG: uncharacterized protein JWN48_1475 [Myxococcaceae bacterium]|nr:uncharacterized protein [Myxococcaceae bacterium]